MPQNLFFIYVKNHTMMALKSLIVFGGKTTSTKQYLQKNDQNIILQEYFLCYSFLVKLAKTKILRLDKY